MNTLTASNSLRGLIAIAIVAAVSATAVASDPTRQTVKFADLNISTPEGASALYTRIHEAAAAVCSHYIFTTDDAADRCVRDSTAKAVTRVNQPALYAVYNTKNKKPLPVLLAGPQPR